MKQKILVGEYDMPNWLSEGKSFIQPRNFAVDPIPLESRNLIENILKQEPLERTNIRQILSHDWFTKPCAMSPTPGDYFQSLDILPVTIPEEACSPALEMLGEVSPSLQRSDQVIQDHSTDGSVASTSSWHSASDSDTGLGIKSSCSNTPVTSDESEGMRSYSPGSNDLEKAVNRDRNDNPSIRRNASQTTITKSESLLSLSRQAYGSPKVNRPDPAFRFPPPSPRMLDNLPHGSPSLPIPAHSRTPSRTKRRSIGSNISERMLPSLAGPVLPDYFSMLSNPTPAPFSTLVEKHLLEALSTIGFDTGQIIHSVRTDACDASGAVWWMLALKAEEREAENTDPAFVSPPKSNSITSLAQSTGQLSIKTPQDISASQAEGPHPVQGLPTPEKNRLGNIGRDTEGGHVPSPALSMQEQADTKLEYGGAAHTPSPRKPRILTTHGVRMSSVSAPALSPRMKTIDQDCPTPELPEGSTFFGNGHDNTGSFTIKVDGRKPTSPVDTMKAERPQPKPRSASVSTVNMLQRATSALGVSTNRKDKADEANAIDLKLASAELGRTTQNLLGGGLFSRKITSSGPILEKPTLVQRTSKEGVDPTSHLQDSVPRAGSQSPNPSKINATSRRQGIPTPLESPAHPSPPLIRQGSPDAQLQASQGSSVSYNLVESSSPSKNDPLRISNHAVKPSRGSKNLFTSFRQWFNDDRRKQKRQRQSSSPLVLDAHHLSRTSSLRRPVVHAPSPLKRPPLARVPSNAPSSTGLSRRNSSTSGRRMSMGDQASPLLGHHRRRSDSSRHSLNSKNGIQTPTSERGDRGRLESKESREPELSRPPSSQSVIALSAEAYNLTRKRHGRASSTSSAGSRHSTMIISGSPVAAYRRTPSVTQVRRLSVPRNDKSSRHPQSRNHSNPSSVHTDDSRRSSLSDGTDEDHDIIEEENENVDIDDMNVEAERSRTLQKLSEQDIVPLSPPLKDDMALDASTNLQGLNQSRDVRSPESYLPPQSTQQYRHARHPSSSSISAAHGNAVFAAHKVVNPFGTPNGSHFQPHSHLSRNSKEIGGKPKLRDVFKNKKPDGEGDDWVDEEEEGIDSYSGGFGQASSNKPTPSLSLGQNGRSYGGLGVTTGISSRENNPVGTSLSSSSSSSTSTAAFGEGRYAGFGLARDDCAPPNVVSWRTVQNTRAPGFKRAATVAEEEEEEEGD